MALVNQLDRATLALNTIDYEHHEIHSGSHYFVSSFSSLAASGTINFCYLTPNTTSWHHMLWDIESTSEAQFKVFEGADFDTGGTLVTPYNSDRNSTKTSAAVIRLNASVTTAGTILKQKSWGVSGIPSKVLGGGSRSNNELILKQNTKYVFQIINITGANLLSYAGFWYEHTNKS